MLPDLNAKLVYRENLRDDLAIFRMVPDGWELPTFIPGQYATLGLPKTIDDGRIKMIKRLYSIASPPNLPYLEFYIVLVDEGELTPLLWKLQEGDRIWLSQKILGKFTLDPVPTGQNLIAVSTGTGLAPYLSMMEHYRHQERWNRLVIMHGARTASELGYREYLEKVAAEDDSIVYVPSTTREPEGSPWPGLRGRVNTQFEDGVFEEITGVRLDPETCHVFLCGNPDMIEQMTEKLEERGFKKHHKREPGNLHFEKYW